MNNTKYLKGFRLSLLILIAVSVLFTVFSVSFRADVSLLAFPVCLVFTCFFVWTGFFGLLKTRNQKYFFPVLKLVQYSPTVYLLAFILKQSGKEAFPYILDLILALLWVLVFVFSFAVQYYMSDKRTENFRSFWDETCPERVKPKGLKRLGFEIIDWVDALLQVVFLVFIFQVFTFQLYVIPSESMVPEFLVKDRVIVEKVGSGPKFPLTDVGLPAFTEYKRGDIVVLRNPHYTLDRKSEIKTVWSQMVYMMTFMMVNLNKDEDGEMKADPLVKRICGLEGEQLVMQDGVLYTRTKDSDVFKPVPEKEDFACWNLNSTRERTRQGIQTFPLTENEYQYMIDFEEERRNYDLSVAEFQCHEISRNMAQYCKKTEAGSFKAPGLFEYELFRDNYELTIRIMTQEGGLEWFTKFMTSWIPYRNEIRDVYSESNFRLNVMTKAAFGALVLRNAELISSGVSSVEWKKDEIINRNMELAEKLNWYIQIDSHLDMRNMPVFPPNDADGNAVYIPKNCYFMMGDNRFNSLDLRHSYDTVLKPLYEKDPLSVTYYSMMAPQYLNKKYILGKPFFRFLPLARVGKINRH